MYKRIQRGRGLGGFFSSLLKLFSKAAPAVSRIMANPNVKKVGKLALQSALRTGGKALTSNDLKTAVDSEINLIKKKVGKAMLKRARTDKKTSQDAGKKSKTVTIKNLKKKKTSSSLF